MPQEVLVAMSGGVDSSVAAAMLLRQGYRVVGMTMKTFCYADQPVFEKSCCGIEGIEAARSVCATLGIEHLVCDVGDEFAREVVENFVSEYAAGRTPNPCVICNATVKIPFLLKKARSMGIPMLATGHYARIKYTRDGTAVIFRGVDVSKDQSYFLWKIPGGVLQHVLFPVGAMSKNEVRVIAADLGLKNAQKPESQEICFVPDGNYVGFLKKHLPREHPGFSPGEITDVSGRHLGTHEGYLAYTIGQRKGLGGGHGQRLYVTDILADRNRIIVGPREELAACGMTIDSANFFEERPQSYRIIQVQVRHRAKPVNANASDDPQPDGGMRIMFRERVFAVTPGQSAVLYDGEKVVGGGRILTMEKGRC